jgi:cytochrome P450
MSIVDLDLESIRWADWSHDPYPLYRVLRDQRPVYYDAPNDMYVLTRYEDISAVLADPRRFSNAARYLLDNEEALISPLREADPPRHTFLRRIVAPMFTPGVMRGLEPYFRTVARELLDAAERNDVVEISSQIAIPLPGRVTCDLLGVPLDQHQVFLELTAERLELLEVMIGRAVDHGGYRTLEAVREDLLTIVAPVMEARRVEPRRDAITLLVQAQDRYGPDEISDQLIVDMLLHLLTGGFHTTQFLVEMLTSLLADRHDLWQRLRADRSLVFAAIEEMLRFDAPVQALRRRAINDLVIRDTAIPADAELSVVYGSANRDERAFDDPDTFSLDRRGTRHLAFSAGIHYCPGAPVSRFEVRALFDEMLDRYEVIERAGPSERWQIEQPTVEAMHGFKSVPVRLRRDLAAT